MMRTRLAVCLMVGLAGLRCVQGGGQEPGKAETKRTLVRAGHVLDVKTGKLSGAETIVVVGAKITSIEPTASFTPEPNDAVVDLGGMTVMPGLIDVLTHVTKKTEKKPNQEKISTDAKQAINGVVN